MPERHDPINEEAFRRQFRRWGDVVCAYLAGRRRRAAPPEEYRGLYRTLLTECRRRAANAEPGSNGFYAGLAELIEPWLATEAFVHTDREILADLLARQRRAERTLGIRRANLRLWRWLFGGLVVVLGVSAIALGLSLPAGEEAWRQAASWGATFWYAVRAESTRLWLGLAGGVSVILGALFLMRTART